MGISFAKQLSAKVLALTIGFVLLAELLIFVPSLSDYHHRWLEERAVRAGNITVALSGVPNYEGNALLSERFMDATGVMMVATQEEGMSRMVLGSPPLSGPFEIYNLETATTLGNVATTFSHLWGSSDGVLRVLAPPALEGQESLEYLVPKSVLQEALRDYCHRILLLSLFIALFTGLLLYVALSMMIVRPVRKLAEGLTLFRENPEVKRSNAAPSRRADEIGQLEREFYDMKQSVRGALKQQDRLAALGLAVAKINHDLRNVLSTAQLVSDRVAMSEDEKVAKMGSRLLRTIDRGVKLCAEVLDYSKSDTGPTHYDDVALGDIIADIVDDYAQSGVTFDAQVAQTVWADPDHTYRIIENLTRNAVQAMDGKADARLLFHMEDGLHLHISDTGPGLPDKVRAGLFKAFMGGRQKGSTGLGLTIAKELARAQGGDITLVRSDETGTEFRVSFVRASS